MQYVVLMSRVRQATKRCPSAARGWWKIARYRVAPVIASTQVVSLLGILLYKAASAPCVGRPLIQLTTFVYRIASVLSELLTAEEKRQLLVSVRAPEAGDHALEAEAAPREIIVSSSMLARSGFPWRGKLQPARLHAAAREQFGIRAAEPGGLAVLLLPGVVGKLVHIEAVEKELDWSAVSASVDTDPYGSRGPPGALGAGRRGKASRPRSAWHAVRTHHHCRLLGVPEAACERVGSIMKHQWQKNPRASVSALMDSTSLSAARVTCSGVARDEALCRAVVDTMLMLGRRPLLARRAMRATEQAGIVVSRSVDKFRGDAWRELCDGGLDDGFDANSDGEAIDMALDSAPPRSRAAAADIVASGTVLSRIRADITRDIAKGQPSMRLPEEVERELARATQRGSIAALPLHQERRRASGTPAPAGSELRKRLALWLDSEQGREWKKKRDARVAEALGGSGALD